MKNMFITNAAKGSNDFWKYLVVMLLVFVGYNLGQIPLMAILFYKISNSAEYGQSDLNEFLDSLDFAVFGISPNLGFILLLMSFVAAFVLFYFIFPAFHKRAFKTVITWKEKINWGKVLFAFGLWFSLGVMIELVMYFLHPENYIVRFNIAKFIPLLLISIFILPIQTTTEEVLFRGYLMQGIALGTKNKIIALLVTSVLFGLIHSMNPEIKEFGFGVMQFYYIGAGLLLGIMTLMDDGLELAIGVHAATNFVGATIVGYEGAALQTDSILKTTLLNPTMMTIGFYIMGLIFLFVCAKKYDWPSFKSLLEPIVLDGVNENLDAV